MKVSHAKPFFFEHGKRAVLLLHGFTGTSADVRMIGRFLEKKGYTSLAPHYKGHGGPAEELITTGPDDWWPDVIQAYDQLKDAGFNQIAVAGLSLGGVFSLKLGAERPVLGIVTMNAPMSMRSLDQMYEGVLHYAREYKKLEGKDEEIIDAEVAALREKSMPSLTDLQKLIENVRAEVDTIYAPLLVVQSTHDEVIDPDSGQIIYDNAESTDKKISLYEKSKHVITLGPEKNELHEEIFEFLESLDWED
ncbi:alpha/beta fold hydrolase [Sporosarcina jeotgali]|uniref:Alpha/beta fold hydrolase n=1 Tax=Sporosarcina jeotgali TaxID=3020056 RepID=A0ABZ0KUD6_9BACL|nr:alpha/beta fold hydrolase [Sporosarcina sp. B2O-1]WOV83477.1 alpha/beta fold hydrolase [Sporosarcina sp. B2O-1]